MIETSTVMVAMAKSGMTAVTKELVSRALTGWGGLNLTGRKAIRYLDSETGFVNYLTKHVANVIRIRTIHSNESDVFLNEIYYPLNVTEALENKPENEKNILCVDDDFIFFNLDFVNIIGIAGQGKSTILRKTFTQYMKYGDKIPIFIELRKIESTGLLNGIGKIFKSIGMDYSESTVKEVLKQNKLALFLDGFDEISSSYRRSILDEIIEIYTIYETEIVTTTRPDTEICKAINIKNYNVNRLERIDIVGIIKKLKEHNPEIIKEDTDNIIKKINTEDKLVEVMVSPLLVTLFYICYPYMDLIPNNAIEFYNNLFNTLYIRHDKLKSYTREKRSDLSNKQAFDSFCAFSFISLQRNLISMTHHELVSNTQISLSNIGLENPKKHNPEHLCEDFVDVTCLLQKDGYMRYSFLHKSICEFHAASFIQNTSLELKPKFYEMMIAKVLSNDVAILNTVYFLRQMDGIDFSKHFIMPLLYKVNVNQWASPSDEKIDQYIDSILEKSTSILKKVGDSIRIIRTNFEMNNTWIDIVSRHEVSKNLDIVHDVFIELNGKNIDFNKFEVDDVVEINSYLLLDDTGRERIRNKLRLIMSTFHADVYITTKQKIELTENNMLSLLKIS